LIPYRSNSKRCAGGFLRPQPTQQPIPVSASTIQPAARPEPPAPNTTYKTRDNDPAGGIVFYDAAGTITVTSDIAGVIMIDGEVTGARIKAGGTVTVANVSTGATEVVVKSDDGKIVKAPQTVMVQQG